MTIKQKFIAVFLSVIFISITVYLLLNYERVDMLDSLEELSNSSPYLINTPANTIERYKIINIVYDHEKVYAVVHMENGNIRVLQITEAYIDPELKNINEGYLYRDSMQIYIRKE